jgi:hypothetical protein
MTGKPLSGRVLIVAALGIACGHPTGSAGPLPIPGGAPAIQPLPLRAGHDGSMPIEDPVVRRFAGHVSQLGTPGQNGHLYIFETAALRRDADRFPPGSLRSWRLTFVSGDRFGAVYRVANNTDTEVIVTSAGDPLDGVAVGDGFLIEDQIERSYPARR